MRDAHRRKDLSSLEAVVADDFTIIHANGDLLTKEEWFADLRSGATGWEQLDVHDIVAKVFGDVAVVLNRQHVRGRLRAHRSRRGLGRRTPWSEKADVGTS